MTKARESVVAEHNVTQRNYFEATVKPTMIPSETPYLRRQVDAVVKAAQLTANSRVLEVGCGMGRYTLLLKRMGIAVEGSDISQVLLDRLTAYAGDGVSIPLHCADVADPPHGGRVDPRRRTRLERMGIAIVELDLDLSAVQEVELLLLIVEMPPGLVSGREDDRVDAECRDAERPADLPEAVFVTHLVDVADRVPLALNDPFAHDRIVCTQTLE